MTVHDMLTVLQAFKEGKKIQAKTSEIPWTDTTNIVWDFRNFSYRVKPEQFKVLGFVNLFGNSPVFTMLSGNKNLELTFEEGKLIEAKVL